MPGGHEAVLEARDVFLCPGKAAVCSVVGGWFGALLGAVLLVGVLWNEVPRERLAAWLSCYLVHPGYPILARCLLQKGQLLTELR